MRGCFAFSLGSANDTESKKGGGEDQIHGLADVYRKVLKPGGIVGPHRGFIPSVMGIIVYHGLYPSVNHSLSGRTRLLFPLTMRPTDLTAPVLPVMDFRLQRGGGGVVLSPRRAIMKSSPESHCCLRYSIS